MTDNTFEAQLQKVSEVIDTLPESQRESLRKMLEETHRRHSDIKGAATRAREAIDNWRLMCKYLIFDLEARLREADAHRRDCENDTET